MKIELNLNDWENILWALDHLINTLSDEFKDETVEETQSKVLKIVRPQKIWNIEEVMNEDIENSRFEKGTIKRFIEEGADE